MTNNSFCANSSFVYSAGHSSIISNITCEYESDMNSKIYSRRLYRLVVDWIFKQLESNTYSLNIAVNKFNMYSYCSVDIEYATVGYHFPFFGTHMKRKMKSHYPWEYAYYDNLYPYLVQLDFAPHYGCINHYGLLDSNTYYGVLQANFNAIEAGHNNNICENLAFYQLFSTWKMNGDRTVITWPRYTFYNNSACYNGSTLTYISFSYPQSLSTESISYYATINRKYI